MADDKTATKMASFRLPESTIADLDAIAENRTGETGCLVTRTDALRYAAKQIADRVRKKKSAK